MSLPSRRLLLRAAGLLPAVGLPGCSFLDDIFESDKPPIPGNREAIVIGGTAVRADAADQRAVVLPAAVQNAEWSQAGGVPTHVMGNLVCGARKQWASGIGEGGGYRQKITSTPVIAGGLIYTMDSDAQVTALDVATGARRWRTDTQADEDRSTNVGGGLAFAGGRLYATTGRGEALALDAGSGKIAWRSGLDGPARSAPTVVDGKLFVPTIDSRMVAITIADGKRLWSYQATASATIVLGEPAPAYSDGLVVGGFGSGDLVALRADSGTLAWSDSLAAARGRNSLADLSAIRAMPAIVGNVTYAIGVGRLMLALDLRSGRRLWEREIAGQNAFCVAGDWLFVLTLDQVLLCLNRADGRVRWSAQLARYENAEKQRGPIFWTGPLLGGQVLYLAGSTGKLIAVNAADGSVLGEQALSDKPSVAPVAAMGRMFIVTDDATLTAYS